MRQETPHDEAWAPQRESSPLTATRESTQPQGLVSAKKTTAQIMSSLLTRARQPLISQGSVGLISSLFPTVCSSKEPGATRLIPSAGPAPLSLRWKPPLKDHCGTQRALTALSLQGCPPAASSHVPHLFPPRAHRHLQLSMVLGSLILVVGTSLRG